MAKKKTIDEKHGTMIETACGAVLELKSSFLSPTQFVKGSAQLSDLCFVCPAQHDCPLLNELKHTIQYDRYSTEGKIKQIFKLLHVNKVERVERVSISVMFEDEGK